MKPHRINFINAIVLIVMPVVGYLLKDSPSITSLIPAVFGLLLLGCQKGIKNQSNLITPIAIVLTLLVLLLLIMPLLFVIRKEDAIGIIQVSTMMITSSIALTIFIKTSIDLRKARKKT